MWLVDSGCSRHMTGDSRWLSSPTRASDNELIMFGDTSTRTMTAKGTVRVNNNFILKDIALVSKLRYNLLSVSQLLDEGLVVRFMSGECRVLNSSVSMSLGSLGLRGSLGLILVSLLLQP